MFAVVSGEAQRLTSMDFREAANDRHQFALSRHIEAEHRVATFFAVKGDPFDNPLQMFNWELIWTRRSFL
jgi:hypothetical protein